MATHSSESRQAVFVVTCGRADRFAAMTRIAVASLRLTNPGVRVCVACDRQTDTVLRTLAHPLVDEADEWVVVATPDGPSTFRNRFVKTRVRDHLAGPYLHLDSDVLVRGDLGEVFRLDADVAGGANGSRPGQISPRDTGILRAMGWTCRDDIYLNGGVLFINETPGARRFCREWHARWLQGCAALSRQEDQPALNAAVHAASPRLVVLRAALNAQFRHTVGVAVDAVIWHYYASVGRMPDTGFELLADALVRGASLDPAHVAALIARPYPWRQTTPLDTLAARRIVARGQFDGWEARWLRRGFRAALRRRAAGLLRRSEQRVHER